MLIIGDTHIVDEALDELELIFKEIDSYIEVDEPIVQLGDLFDKKRPSPKEIDFTTKWITHFQEKTNYITVLRGNHPTIDDKTSSVEYLQWLGISLTDELETINLYCGHFIVNESIMNFNNTTKSIKELEKFKYVFLGHQHHPQDLGNNRYHLGSVRYTSFGELNSDKKKIARLKGTLTTPTSLEFIELKSPIPLVEVFSISELEDVDFSSKVRLTIKTFEQFKNDMGKVQKWKDKFKAFKVKLDFTNNPAEVKKIDKVDNLRTVIEKWLAEINDVDVKKELEEEFNETK